MKTMSGVDGAFLHLETPETPMHVASLHLFELPAGHRGDFHADIRKLMRSRLTLAPVFTRQLAPLPLQLANPAWAECEAVDLDYHVQRITLSKPGSIEQLEDCAGRLHAEPLDRRRPLWRIWVIDGLPGRQVGYYIKVHHAVLDGQAGVLLAQALFDLTPRPRRIARPARHAAEHPGLAALAAATLRHDAAQVVKLLRHLPDVLRTFGGMLAAEAAPKRSPGTPASGLAFGPRTALNVPITAARGFAARSLPMDELKAIAAAHDATLNDIVLALCAGALRRWLKAHGGVPRRPLVAAMPISLRDPGNHEYTTQATMSLVNLNTHIADPERRLLAIRDAARAVKAMARRAKHVIPTDFPSIGTPWLLHGLATLYGRSGLAKALPPVANVVISNVPGPQVPLYAAGARMLTYWPMSIVEHGVALNVTVMSYAGAMGFGFTTARDAVGDAREFVVALDASFAELKPRTAAKPRRARASSGLETRPS